MNSTPTEYRQQNFLALLNEGVALFKAGGIRAALLYYGGSLPFMTGLLFFWSDMARSSSAAGRLAPAALGMAVSFIWMKVLQALFCQDLYRLRTGLPPERLSTERLIGLVVNQTSVQPLGLLLIPLSLALILPFARTYAFFQNFTILDTGRATGEVKKQAKDQARLWPLQNHLLIWILSPWLLGCTLALCFGFAAFFTSLTEGIPLSMALPSDMPWLLIGVLLLVLGLWPACPLAMTVALNLTLLFWMLPGLLNTLFGIETTFVRAGLFSMANSTALLIVYSATHLLLDPVMKATYVLRCFYGHAARNGADILADLKRLTLPLLLVTLLTDALLSPAAVSANQPPAPRQQAVAQLNEAIDRTLQKPEYAWRIPRPAKASSPDFSFFDPLLSYLTPLADWSKNMLKRLATAIKKFILWIRDLFGGDKESTADKSTDWSGMAEPGVLLLAALAGILGLWQLIRFSGRKKENDMSEAPAFQAPPDLSDDQISADLLPEEQWLKLARQKLADNQPRLALRAFYLAALASLNQEKVISIRPCKSNREYGREVGRFSHTYPELPGLFEESVRVFEKVWYGDYPVHARDLEVVRHNQNAIRGYFAAGH